jgi:acetyltransferase-like isoleucine patch superfamily enzyme
MSFMNVLKNIVNYLRNRRKARYTPQMMNNFIGREGKALHKTRVSNATFIDNLSNFDLAENVYIGHFNFIEASNGLRIEEGCQITSFVTITTHSSHQSIRLYGKNYGGAEMKAYIKGGVSIGKYTFVGPHTTIMPNTKIGKGSVVTAYSYVQGEFPDFAIIAGNPAVVVGDTRQKDEEMLTQFPELKANYSQWSDVSLR